VLVGGRNLLPSQSTNLLPYYLKPPFLVGLPLAERGIPTEPEGKVPHPKHVAAPGRYAHPRVLSANPGVPERNSVSGGIAVSHLIPMCGKLYNRLYQPCPAKRPHRHCCRAPPPHVRGFLPLSTRRHLLMRRTSLAGRW